MYIITDVASLENIPEGTKASKIMILCKDEESFAAQDVSKMLALSAQMTPVPKGSSFAFAFGKIAGGLNGKPEDTIILSADPEVTKAAEAFGYSTVIAKQKRVTRTRKKKKSGVEWITDFIIGAGALDPPTVFVLDTLNAVSGLLL